jgi:Protein of unknown function (DUF1353)
MSSFTDKLEVSPNDDCSSWTIASPFRYWLTELHKGDVITIPTGAQTDFASIPRVFWAIMSPYGRYGKAAIVHDYLYRNGGYVNVAEDGQPIRMRQFSRAECDQILYDAMVCSGVNWLQRKIIYAGVRVGGWASFPHHEA